MTESELMQFKVLQVEIEHLRIELKHLDVGNHSSDAVGGRGNSISNPTSTKAMLKMKKERLLDKRLNNLLRLENKIIEFVETIKEPHIRVLVDMLYRECKGEREISLVLDVSIRTVQRYKRILRTKYLKPENKKNP